MNLADRIQREIRRRAFDRMDLLQRQSARAQLTQHTIDALEQVTGLPRLELETIAGQVNGFFNAESDGFFSIKDQLIISAAVFIPVLIFIWLTIRWIPG